MRELAVYAITLNRRSGDPVPSGRHSDCRQIKAIVATRTKKEAQALFGVSSSEMNGYASKTGNEKSLETALAKPGQVFAKAINDWDGDYFEIFRDPHVVYPRRRPISVFTALENQRAKREVDEFTNDELIAIMERFAMANDPIGQSIVAKASRLIK